MFRYLGGEFFCWMLLEGIQILKKNGKERKLLGGKGKGDVTRAEAFEINTMNRGMNIWFH